MSNKESLEQGFKILCPSLYYTGTNFKMICTVNLEMFAVDNIIIALEVPLIEMNFLRYV